ncbi:MAG: chalcone isomerase family protein [Litorivicinaceae bacterium]|nr:chalcone isomerase family protein [Litorivicinaceae bacterium]
MARPRLTALSKLLLIVLWLTTSASVASAERVPESYCLVGAGRLSVLFWDIYNIQLWAPDGQYRPDQPFALELQYLRSVDRETIAETSVEEIQQQANLELDVLADWQIQLIQIFPDIQKGDRLIGLYAPQMPSQFFLNGTSIGVIDDANLSRHFFDIWLSEETSKPQLRLQLLGMKSP